MNDKLFRALHDVFKSRPPKRLGIAVSGGGDSVALLCLAAEYAKSHPIEIHAVTVDHGLRPAAKEEVRAVTKLCGNLGVPHHVEFWKNWSGEGNLMAQARNARYDLMSSWALENEVDTIAIAHTANDQAETMLMRLARGSGVDGLTGMMPRRIWQGVTWLRPLLRIHRRDLRLYLEQRNVTWIEDPTNENRDFERIRMRDALNVLEPLGLTTDTLVDVAYNMSKAREALDWQTFLATRDLAKVSHGAIAIDVRRYRTQQEEIARRMLVRALAWVSGRTYSPRRTAVLAAIDSIREGRNVTLDGCHIVHATDLIWIFREFNAVRDTTSMVGDSWDDRWTVEGPEDDDRLVVRALGEDGLKQLKDWRKINLPREALASSPSVWDEGVLIAAPVVGFGEGWTAELEGGNDSFYAAILSH
ncbi:MAG: tRNA lysidine(34) synthetase TilS [Paracoccaceae bacterium]